LEVFFVRDRRKLICVRLRTKNNHSAISAVRLLGKPPIQGSRRNEAKPTISTLEFDERSSADNPFSKKGEKTAQTYYYFP